MSGKSEVLELEGKVVECLPGARFVVELDDNQHKVDCTISGQMRFHFIRLVRGDKVKIEMTPYDLTKGRIIFRK